jgi:hypothetical protein
MGVIMDMFNRYALVSTVLDTANMPSHVVCEASSLDELMQIVEDVDHPLTPFPRAHGFDKIRAVVCVELYPRMLWDHSIGDVNLMPAYLSGPVCLGHMFFVSQGPYSLHPVEEYSMEDIMEHDGQFSHSIYAIPDDVSDRSASSMLDYDGYTGYDDYDDDYEEDDPYFDDDGLDMDARYLYEDHGRWNGYLPVPRCKVRPCKASRDLEEEAIMRKMGWNSSKAQKQTWKKKIRRHDRRQTKKIIEYEMMVY